MFAHIFYRRMKKTKKGQNHYNISKDFLIERIYSVLFFKMILLRIKIEKGLK